MAQRFFLSDNAASVHPAVLKALTDANEGHAEAYGSDPHTKAARAAFNALFEREVETFFVFNGTGANNVALCAMSRPYGSILCAQTAHINCDEVGAPEKLTGCHLHAVATPDGKVRPSDFTGVLPEIGVQHHSQPAVIYISQCSEMGTVYTAQEVRALADFAHAHGMKLMMDGARISNALVSLGCKIADITWKAGGGRGCFRRHEKRPDVRRSARAVRQRACPRLAVHPQAKHAARLQNALYRGAI